MVQARRGERSFEALVAVLSGRASEQTIYIFMNGVAPLLAGTDGIPSAHIPFPSLFSVKPDVH